ncbi:MAG: hypothetical protein ACLS9K_03310 [Lachnospira eligens]
MADMLKNAGFNYYTIFNERKPEFIRYDELRLILYTCILSAPSHTSVKSEAVRWKNYFSR